MRTWALVSLTKCVLFLPDFFFFFFLLLCLLFSFAFSLAAIGIQHSDILRLTLVNKRKLKRICLWEGVLFFFFPKVINKGEVRTSSVLQWWKGKLRILQSRYSSFSLHNGPVQDGRMNCLGDVYFAYVYQKEAVTV